MSEITYNPLEVRKIAANTVKDRNYDVTLTDLIDMYSNAKPRLRPFFEEKIESTFEDMERNGIPDDVINFYFIAYSLIKEKYSKEKNAPAETFNTKP